MPIVVSDGVVRINPRRQLLSLTWLEAQLTACTVRIASQVLFCVAYRWSAAFEHRGTCVARRTGRNSTAVHASRSAAVAAARPILSSVCVCFVLSARTARFQRCCCVPRSISAASCDVPASSAAVVDTAEKRRQYVLLHGAELYGND